MASVRQRALLLGRQDIDFDQGVAGSIVFTAHNGGGIARWPRRNDGGFFIIGRRFSACLNFCLLRVFPIVVRSNEEPFASRNSNAGSAKTLVTPN